MGQVRPSQTAAQELLRLVMLVMQSVSAEMRCSRRHLEPTQMGSLIRIATGPCTMTDLARHKAVSLSTISKSVGMLVRRGWVERWVDKHDRRQTLVRLTGAGRRTLTDIQQRAERHVAEKLSPLTAAESDQLMFVLKRLTAVLGRSDDARVGKRGYTQV
jgi:DNA-binding MarR family transcriptional regulator